MQTVRSLPAVLLLVLVSLPASADENPIHALGPGDGVLIWDGGFRTCAVATFLLNSDGTCENAFCVRHGFLAPPDGGAFAECFTGDGQVCAITLDLTTAGGWEYDGETLDVIVWQDAGGQPGSVVCLTPGLHPSDIGIWPEFTRHEFEIPEGCCVAGAWWAGMRSGWGNFATPCFWYYGADQSDPGGSGCPLVRVPPGLGLPEGWQPVSTVFFGEWTNAMGIGVLLDECPPIPARQESWGRVKALYR